MANDILRMLVDLEGTMTQQKKSGRYTGYSKRDYRDIEAAILDLCNGNIYSRTQIMLKAGLGSVQAIEFTDRLVANGMLTITNAHYKTTEKGLAYLKKLNTLREFLG